jgi:hypothetical protein
MHDILHVRLEIQPMEYRNYTQQTGRQTTDCTRLIEFCTCWGHEDPQRVPLVVSFERRYARRHNATQLVFRPEGHRVGTYFPWDYLTCFFLTKELLGKHLGLAHRCGLLCSSLWAKRTTCFDAEEPCIFPTEPECTYLYVSYSRDKGKVHPRTNHEGPDRE